MSATPAGPSIEVTIRETLPNGKSRHTSRWVHAGPKGWTSADNLGREHLSHADEAAARTALSGWMRSQAAAFGDGPATEPEKAPVLEIASIENAEVLEAADDDLIG